jgi:hypothetical protein
LSSAEKIATDPDIQKELSRRLDVSLHKWLEELHRLKRLVQVAPIKNANSSILEDLIIKEANILAFKGFPKAAEELIKIAQAAPAAPPAPPSAPPIGAPPPSDAPIGAELPPIGAPSAKPGIPTPSAGKGLPKPTPKLPVPSPSPGAVPPIPAGPASKPKDPGEENLEEFVKNLNIGKNNKDNNQIVDPLNDDLFGITIQADDSDESDELAEIEVFAQALPPETSMPANVNAPVAMANPSLPAGAATVSDLASVAPVAVPASMPAKKPAQLTKEIEVSDEGGEGGSEFADTKLHKRTDDLLESALSV